MKQKIESKLKGVSKTLLITLRARYLETKKTNGIISDPKSVEILDRIEYDFSGKNEISVISRLGVVIRTEILDEQTEMFLSKNPDAVVVNLGCGLDTRFYRLNNNMVKWYDLDLPEAIELRKQFFAETDNYKFISKSVFDFSWMKIIPKNKPTLFIAEGLLMYFTEDEVKLILKKIGEEFLGSEMLFEAVPTFMAKRSMYSDVKKHGVQFKWGIKTGKKMEKWDIGIQFINEWYYVDRHKDKQPFLIRLASLLPPLRKSVKIIYIKFSAK